MSFQVSTEQVGDRVVYRLFDFASGASASILPSYGFNLFDLRLPVAGEVRPIVAAEPNWAARPSKPGRNGIPVLFPFPNRIRDAHFSFEGKSYSLPVNKAPNAIHGFAIEAPWDVVEFEATPFEAFSTGQFRISDQAPDMLAHWPADAILRMRYGLSAEGLSLAVRVTNPAPTRLPFGFGIHSYFRLPFDPDGDRARTRVVLPASEFWVQNESLPTGERRPVDARLDFRTGRPMAGLQLDDVLTGLSFDGERGVCRLVDEELGTEFRLTFDRSIRELVVFTPPGPGGVIAIEPYTQTTDAIHLQQRGIDAGLRILEPGESFEMAIAMETGPATSGGFRGAAST